MWEYVRYVHDMNTDLHWFSRKYAMFSCDVQQPEISGVEKTLLVLAILINNNIFTKA